MDQANHRPILDSHESTENALMDSFKAAAVRVTTLYKDSLVENRKAYGAGYQQALQDLYAFISSRSRATSFDRDGLPIMMPVQDILTFARERNAQLMSEMGRTSDASSSGLSQHSDGSNPTHSVSSAEANEDGEKAMLPQPSSHPSALFASEHPQLMSHHDPDSAVLPLKTAFTPFHIDPSTQFTFTFPADIPSSQALYSMHPGQTGWAAHQQENTGDGLKRRHMSSELSFLGRSLSNMNVDMFGEPPFKRNRPKREE